MWKSELSNIEKCSKSEFPGFWGHTVLCISRSESRTVKLHPKCTQYLSATAFCRTFNQLHQFTLFIASHFWNKGQPTSQQCVPFFDMLILAECLWRVFAKHTCLRIIQDVSEICDRILYSCSKDKNKKRRTS